MYICVRVCLHCLFRLRCHGFQMTALVLMQNLSTHTTHMYVCMSIVSSVFLSLQYVLINSETYSIYALCTQILKG